MKANREDVKTAHRAAGQAWLAAGCPIAPPELSTVPPCRECGHVPTQYHRIGKDVQCLDRRACVDRQDAAILARFNLHADWDGETPCAEVFDTAPVTVRVPIGGGWSTWQENPDGTWTEIE